MGGAYEELTETKSKKSEDQSKAEKRRRFFDQIWIFKTIDSKCLIFFLFDGRIQGTSNQCRWKAANQGKICKFNP